MKADHSDILVETEAKFAIPDEHTLARLSTAPTLGGVRLTAPQTIEVEDVYFDTDTRAVEASGFALRRREAGGRITTTLKRRAPAQDGIHRREEISVQADGPPQGWPDGPARELAMRVVGEQALRALLSVSQRRTVRQIRDGRRVVGTLSLDDVRTLRGRHTDHYYQVEVELGPQGSEADLETMIRSLREEWGLAPETRSKLERAMAHEEGFLTDEQRRQCRSLAARTDLHGRRAVALLALDAGATQTEAGRLAGMSERRARHWSAAFRARRMGVFPRRLLTGEPSPRDRPRHSRGMTAPSALPERTFGAASTMAEAAHHVMTLHFQRLKAHDPGTRAGEDPEHLHDMRVAARRLRAATMVFEDALDPARVRPLRKGLRRLGRALGVVRDLDVFREKATRHIESLPPQEHGELEPLWAVWTETHAAARRRLLDHLGGPRYGRLVAAFEEFLQQPGAVERSPFFADGSPRPRRVGHALPAIVHARVAAVRAFDEWVMGPDTSLPRLHRLRIAAKRLRYTLEFFHETLGPSAESVIDGLSRLQDHLGEIQDATVAIGLLRDYLTWGTWGHVEGALIPREPVLAPGVASYLAVRQRELAGLLASFPAWWDEFRSPWFPSRIDAALATLEEDAPHGAI